MGSLFTNTRATSLSVSQGGANTQNIATMFSFLLLQFFNFFEANVLWIEKKWQRLQNAITVSFTRTSPRTVLIK